MSKSLAFRCCGDRSSRPRIILDTLDKDDKEEKKYSAEEKEVGEQEVKKSVSERKQEIERRISEKQDKKKEPQQPVVLRRSESRERKELRDSEELSKSEKETCEEKSISPEPANLTFDEKRLSFEMGAHTKEKSDKKTEQTQKFLDSEKVAYQIRGTESEPELTFQEKRLSFEKGLMKSVEEKPEILDTKTTKTIHMETITSTETTPQLITKEKVITEVTTETKLLEGVAKGLTDFKEKEKLATEPQGIISPKVSTTPPPSPADVLKAKGGEEWKSTPTSDTDGVQKASVQKPGDSFISKLLQQEFLKKFDPSEMASSNPSNETLPQIPTRIISEEERSFGNPFSTDSESPSIFRRPHQATDFVIFDDEDWDTQDIVDFSDVTKQVYSENVPYAPEKFLEDSSKGELRRENVQILEKPIDLKKANNEEINFVTSALQDLNLPFVSLPTTSQNTSHIVEQTKTTVTAIQNDGVPGEIRVTTVETERRFLPSQNQTFVFNDFSKASDAGDEDSIYECEMNFDKPEDAINVDESLKVLVDLSESCRTSSEDLVQNVDKSETENLVEIVDVTDDIVVSFEPIPSSEKSISDEDKSELLRRLDECIVEDFKPKPKGEEKEINIPVDIKLDSSIDLSFQDVSTKHEPTGSKEKPVEVNVASDPRPSSTSLMNDSRNGRFLGSGGENISRLEDEIDLLEQLEDQIRILNEEESKIIGIETETKGEALPKLNIEEVSSSDIIIDATIAQKENENQSISQNDEVDVAVEEFEILPVSKDNIEVTGSKEELAEERTRKKKNRKRRSKKHKDGELEIDDPVPQTADERRKQTNVKSVTSQATTSKNVRAEKNSEKEFQNIVSQLSVEEVDEALQIWDEALNPLTSGTLSEREEEQQSSSSDQKPKSKEQKK